MQKFKFRNFIITIFSCIREYKLFSAPKYVNQFKTLTIDVFLLYVFNIISFFNSIYPMYEFVSRTYRLSVTELQTIIAIFIMHYLRN